LLQQLYDPSAPNYHQYLNPDEFAQRFGPSEGDYQTLIQFAEMNGLSIIGTHPNRAILDVSGTMEEIEHAFHVNMMSYWRPDRGVFYAPDREPSLDLDAAVLDISGLDNYRLPRPMGLKTLPLAAAKPLVTGSGPYGMFIGSDFRAAYAPGVTLTGAGQSVGLFELDGFYASDEKANFALAGLPAVPTQTVLLDGFSGKPGSGNIEVILDIMMAAYMAPGLTNIIVYEGEVPNDVLNRMATDKLAMQLSSSWGWSPINATTEQIFKQYIAQGQSLLQASGDDGAYEGGVMTPSDDPNLTVVGGSSLTTASAGGAWQSEAAWSGSGGGTSTTYPIPSYQAGTSMASNGGSATMRNIPDVALTADIQIFIIQSNGSGTPVGGTSCAAPLWAGFIALANQQAVSGGKSPIGFLNPQLYSIGNGVNYNSDFHDITQGSNGGFNTTTGYDLVTGWGTPTGQSLINDLSSAPAPPSFTLSTSASSLSVSAGGHGTSTIAVNGENNFSGKVSLAASGLPKGVTAAFSPASTASSSTLTLTASSSAVGGTATVTITGTSGTLKSTATIGVTITVPSFTLSASPSALSLVPGSNTSSALTVTPQNGFTGSISFAASGLPKGVTASFTPATVTSPGTLALIASAAATAGTSTVTVTGTAGALKSTTTVSVTTTVPTFTLAATSTAISLTPGTSASTALSVNAGTGFNGTVSFAATGLPKGVTASFSPATSASATTATFTASSSVAAATANVTITGTYGSVSSTASIGVTVTVPTFTLAASPSTLTLTSGSSGSSTLTVTGQNGFSSNVSFTLSTLPKGVTASFSPASTATGSTLTFVATSTAAAATATVTVTGVAGTVKSTATISLSVVAPNFSLAASPTSVSLTPGASGTSTVTVTPLNGFGNNVILTATGLPKGVTASFSPASASATTTVTFTAASTVVNASSTVTITGTSGSLTHTAPISLAVVVPDFTLTASPASITLPQGGSGPITITLGAVGGFSGTVNLATTSMPKNVTASLGPVGSLGTAPLILTVGSSAAAASGVVTVTGTSGTLTHTLNIAVTVVAASAGGTLVNLSSAFNVTGIVTDNSTFTNGGLDAGGTNGMGEAYSATLLGTQKTVGGATFYFGAPNVPNSVTSQQIGLSGGPYSTLRMLATGVNGNQLAQTFTVTYVDGTTSTFTQSLSDWFTPQNFPGETKGISMAYRDNSLGQKDNRTFLLYEYTFALTKGEQVSSITLPSNSNVVVLAMTLMP
jgi:hypothetical protein